MDSETKLFVEVSSRVLELPTPVVEVGSVQIAEGVPSDLRPYFPEPYIGLDMASGPGVELMANVQCLPFRSRTLGTVVSVATLEHVANPIAAVEEMHRVVQETGVLILTSVFKFPIHSYPSDFWRFTPDCFNLLLEKFDYRIIFSLGHVRYPIWVMGIGFKFDSQKDVTDIELKAQQLHEAYLEKLLDICRDSLISRFFARSRMLPVVRRLHTLSPTDLGLAVTKNMELISTVYQFKTRCCQLQKRLR